ncbi:hypothetical protein [Spiroplasma endosymbiont of Panorpa germanica]|uniref:hypothetical protein n=1 Tax=Spiroplasma endosymbiont of Panorpa germanica TaxID=3066314 RepID=UPI0030D24D76
MQVTEQKNDESLSSQDSLSYVENQKLRVQAITSTGLDKIEIGLDAVFINQVIGSEKNAHFEIYLRPNFSTAGRSGVKLRRNIKNFRDVGADLKNVELKLFTKHGDITKKIENQKKDIFKFGNLKWTLDNYNDYKGFQKIEIPVEDMNLNGSNTIQYELSFKKIDSLNPGKIINQGLITIDTFARRGGEFSEKLNYHQFVDYSLAYAYMQYNPDIDEIGYYREIFSRRVMVRFPDENKKDAMVREKLFTVITQIQLEIDPKELENFGLSSNFFNSIQAGLIVNQNPEVNFNLRSLTGTKIKPFYSVDLLSKIESDNSHVQGFEDEPVEFNVSIANKTVFDPFLGVVRPAFYQEGVNGLIKNPNFNDQEILDVGVIISGVKINFEIPLFNERISNYNMFFLNKYDNIINGDSIEQYQICFLFTPDIISRFVNINDFNLAEFQELESQAEKNV